MLAHVSMWVFFVCLVVTLPALTTVRSGAAWTPSDWPLTFLQCCSVTAQECLNVKTTPPAVLFPSSCVSCVIEYCYWTEHSWTLDSYTSALGFGTGSVMTCSWVKMGEGRKLKNKRGTDFSLDHNFSVNKGLENKRKQFNFEFISALLSPGSRLLLWT